MLTLQNLLISYKNKDIEDAEITKLRNDANALLIQLDNKFKNKTSSIKSLNFLKAEITKFSDSEKPTKELFEILYNRVNIFINLIKTENEKKKLDTLFLPNKDQYKIIDTKNYFLYELIFWYSSIEDNLNKLFDINTTEKESMELTMNLYKNNELDPLMSFISDKKLQFNENLPTKEQKIVKQMLRGLFISKIRNNGINLLNLDNIVDIINSRINFNEEIPDEEYYFCYMISDKYPKNLKLRMPIFEPMDIFYLFFVYDKNGTYKLGEIFHGIKCNFGGKKDIADTILNNEYKDMIKLSEDLGKLFYKNISGKEIENEEKINMIEFLKNESSKENELINDNNNRKELYEKIASCLSYIKLFQENIFNNQKNNPKKYEFKLDDFYNLINKENNKLIDCSNIFKKEKESKEIDKNQNLFSPSFIFYINNNQTFINELFNDINISNNSIIYDLNKHIKIDYLPFWLYILRNISSLNCIEYGKKEIRELEPILTNNISDKIKKKISYCLNNGKPLDLKWLSLLFDNISSEIKDPKINLFYNFFNSLISNLNITGENLKQFAKNELEIYFNNLIDSVFDDNIYKILDENLVENEENIILKFTKNPSAYLYEKIKADINSKFFNNMNSENIYELDENFK